MRKKNQQAGARMLARYVVEVSPSGVKQFAKYEILSRTNTSDALVFDVLALPIGAAIYLYIPGGNDACLRNNDNNSVVGSLLPCVQANDEKVLSVVL